MLRLSNVLSSMRHILKILLKVILKRNKHNIESVISETQSSFMAGKGTREGIYNLRTIIESYVKCGKNIYISVSSTMKRLSTEKCEEY